VSTDTLSIETTFVKRTTNGVDDLTLDTSSMSSNLPLRELVASLGRTDESCVGDTSGIKSTVAKVVARIIHQNNKDVLLLGKSGVLEREFLS
jgi:hypothetical protein